MIEEKVRDFPPVEPPPLESSLYREVDIKKEGVSLIKLLLAIISIFISITIIGNLIQEYREATKIDGYCKELLTNQGNSVDQRFNSVVKIMQDERICRREYWLKLIQLILINALLPILTALLGYIFATRQS